MLSTMEAPSNVALSDSCAGGRPYHHGDLRRALIDAAERVLVRDGAQALSLRAVAREAGVSPAAPYHHFKDKSDLIAAISEDGFHQLGEALKAAIESDADRSLSSIGVSYIKFARANPALYRVMYDSARDLDSMPDKAAHEGGGYSMVKEAMIRAGADPCDTVGLELSCIAAWCAAHGLAEMVGFAQFKPLIEAMGGEDAFMRGVLGHIGAYGTKSQA